MGQAFTKFHEKNQTVFFGQQSAAGLPITDACLAEVTIAGTSAAGGTLVIGSGGNTITATVAASSISAASLITALSNFTKGLGGTTVTNITVAAAGTGATKYSCFDYSNASAAILAIRDSTGTALPLVVGSLVVLTTLTGITLSNFTAGAMIGTAGLAVTSISGSPTRETAAVQYVAGALSRREYTYQKDVYIELQVETPQQVLSNNTTPASIAALLTPSNAIGAGIFSIFESCGGFITLNSANTSALYPNGYIQVDNTQASNTLATCDLHYGSTDDAVYDKLWKFYDLQGLFDLTVNMGDLPMLKFNFKGNVSNPINSLVPIEVANMGNQYLDVTPSIIPSTIVTTQICPLGDTFGSVVAFGTATYALPTDLTGSTGTSNILTITYAHGVNVGDIRTIKLAGETGVNASIYNGTFIAEATDANKLQVVLPGVPTAAPTNVGLYIGVTPAYAFNFGTCNASNGFGFKLDRYMAGQLIGFTKAADPTDVSVTMLEDQSGTTNFDPDKFVTQFFAVKIKWGTGNGNYLTYIWNNLQLAQVKQGKIASYLARDVTFRNTGNLMMIYS